MIRIKKTQAILWIFILIAAGMAGAASKSPLVGEVEKTFALAPENTEVRGLAFDEVSPLAPRLFVLDAAGKVFVYGVPPESASATGELKPLDSIPLPVRANGTPLQSPRGLAYTREKGQDVFYVLNWIKPGGEAESELWKFGPAVEKPAPIDLSLYPYKIGDREVLSLAHDNGRLLVSFDGSGFADLNVRVQRGLIRLAWNPAAESVLDFIKHLPDAGTKPSYGLTVMVMDGTRYLWGTIGRDYLYCAEAETGRGLFHFAWPGEKGENTPIYGLAFGADALWVPEGTRGADLVHRVNVTKNLDSVVEGSRILRHLQMTISTEPEGQAARPGKVYHNYSRPYAYAQLGNQGIWPETEMIVDTSSAPNAAIRMITMDPAGDAAVRQTMAVVEYGDADARQYASRYEIDIWTNPSRSYVYPHRVNKDKKAIQGTNYLADDPVLYNLTDRKTYDEFLARVRGHIAAKYGVPADMDNAYWAVRNIVEYIQDNYYYPSRPKRVPAAVDYHRGHYDANPGNLKIELSNRPYDRTQIIACSGTSVMVAGALRYLGIEARWLGTGTAQGPAAWDKNKNGFLDEDETAPVSNGHRYDQVWLGSRYGWVCFDATPTLPDNLDFDPPPPLQSQWRYMNRAAAGHLKDQRIVFNVSSGLVQQLYRTFEYDEELNVNNDCGGDQRYNLQGTFDKPELWKLAGHGIAVRNICFVKEVAAAGAKPSLSVAWTLQGAWSKDPEARLEAVLQQVDPATGKAKDIAVLRKDIPPDAGKADVNVAAWSGKAFRIVVRKVGDPETGGLSPAFDLN
jgi:hypothetical protein